MSFYIETDLTNVQAWDGQKNGLPPGQYIFEVADAEQAMSSSNEPVVKVTLKVIDDSDQNGNTMLKSYSLKNDKWTQARLKNFLVAIGAPLNGFGKDDLVGRQFQGTVQQRTLPGRMQPNGQPGEPSLISDLMGETSLAPAAKPAAAAAPAASANGRRVVGAATPAPARR